MLPNPSFTHSSCWIQPQCSRYETLYSTSGLKNPPINIYFFPSSQEKQTLAKKNKIYVFFKRLNPYPEDPHVS